MELVKKETISRRNFIKVSSAAALATSIAPTIITSCTQSVVRGPGDVLLSRNEMAAPNLDTINGEMVQQVMDNGIKAFTGKNSVGDAWKSLFPVLNKDTKIGLKVNVVAGTRPKQLCTQVQTVDAIVNGLSQMSVNGSSFSAHNVVVWDRWNDELEGAGYTINEKGPGYLCCGTTATMDAAEPKIGYDGEAPWKSIEDTAYFSKIVSQVCDYQINVPVLKSMGRGVTFGMKNMYGTFSTSYPQWGPIGNIYHKEFPIRMCDVNQADLIQKKFVLHVGDAILGKAQAAGGPAGPADFTYGGMLFCKNPVALDAIGASIVREQGEEVEDAVWQKPAEERGLGIATLENINLIKI